MDDLPNLDMGVSNAKVGGVQQAHDRIETDLERQNREKQNASAMGGFVEAPKSSTAGDSAYGINAEQMAMFLQAATPLQFTGLPHTTFDKSGVAVPVQLPLPDVSSLYASNVVASNATSQPGDFHNMPGVMNSLQNISQMTPEQLQGFMNAPNIITNAGNNATNPGSSSGGNGYKNWWDEKDENELLKLVEDPAYRKDVVGTEELDWSKLEMYFSRSQNALRKKYWSIRHQEHGSEKQGASKKDGESSKGALTPSSGRPGEEHEDLFEKSAKEYMDQIMSLNAAGATTGIPPSNLAGFHAGILPLNQLPPQSGEDVRGGRSSEGAEESYGTGRRTERKQWTEDETRQMARIISDSNYARELGVADNEKHPNWVRLAELFHCTIQAAKRKFRSLYDVASQNNGNIPQKGKRQHFRKSVPYRYMVIQALAALGNEATAPQIFEYIEKDPGMSPNLDMRIMPGTKHVPRWKLQIRKVLSSDPVFINTNTKQRHETIWRLDASALQMNTSTNEYFQGEAGNSSNPAIVQPSAFGNVGFEGSSAMAMNYPFTPAGQAAIMAMQLGQRQTSDGNRQVPQGMEGILPLVVDPAMMAAMMANTTAPDEQKTRQYADDEGNASSRSPNKAGNPGGAGEDQNLSKGD